MKTNATLVLKLVHAIFWVLFVGLCIKTGAILISFLVSEFVNPMGAQNLYMGLDLSALKKFNNTHYVGVVSFTLYFEAVKAYMAYLVIQIFRQIDFDAPFNLTVAALITKISHLALGAGLVGLIANGYSKWLAKSVVIETNTWADGEFLFLAGIIFIVAQIYQKGADIQAENALTV